MSSSNKAFRQLAGYTFLNVGTDPKAWFKQACQFNKATLLFYADDQISLIQVCFHIAGLSLELALKAIILAKSKKFTKNHKLSELASIAGIAISTDQECTLELLSECIIWRGRYPTPTSEQYWDKYHDVVLEKHIIREQKGNVYSTLTNKTRFPTQANYLVIWEMLEIEFKVLVTHQE